MSTTDYSTYLRIDHLLDLQHPLTDGAHDEMLFIVIHQVYELWFKLVLHELDHTVSELSANRPQAAIPSMRRTVSIDELLIAQLHVLETMSPEGFLEFRDPLAPAAGFQSGQFRAITFLGGLRDASRFVESIMSRRDRGDVRRRMEMPTLYEALCSCLRECGVDAVDGDGAEDKARRLEAIAELYRDHATPQRALLHELCELYVDHDEAIARWRFHHTLMAAREIGTRPGTGGSRGVEYLRRTIEQRFFPDLWEVRSRL